MREILFRGKDEQGKWVYGAYVHYDDIQDKGKDDCDYIVKKHNGENFPFVKVVPETVGQFTGLTDKNGTKIFEGDIVKNEYEENKYQNLKIAYNEKLYAWVITSNWGRLGMLHNLMGNIEVIGNTHDNPELFKDGEKYNV